MLLTDREPRAGEPEYGQQNEGYSRSRSAASIRVSRCKMSSSTGPTSFVRFVFTVPFIGLTPSVPLAADHVHREPEASDATLRDTAT